MAQGTVAEGAVRSMLKRVQPSSPAVAVHYAELALRKCSNQELAMACRVFSVSQSVRRNRKAAEFQLAQEMVDRIDWSQP